MIRPPKLHRRLVMKMLAVAARCILGAAVVLGGLITGILLLAHFNIFSNSTAPVPPRIAASNERKVEVPLAEPPRAAAIDESPSQPPPPAAVQLQPGTKPAMQEAAASLRAPAAPQPKSAAVIVMYRGSTKIERFEVPSERWSDMVMSRRVQEPRMRPSRALQDDQYRDETRSERRAARQRW